MRISSVPKPGTKFLAARLKRLRGTADLHEPGCPRIDRGEVVDDEGDAGVAANVAELLACAEVMAADVDGAEIVVEVETDGNIARSPVRADRGQPSEQLAVEVGTFLRR